MAFEDDRAYGRQGKVAGLTIGGQEPNVGIGRRRVRKLALQLLDKV